MNHDTAAISNTYLSGGCRCGQVRFRLQTDPIITHCCHCRSCQKGSGSAFAINSMIESDQVTVTAGAPEPFQAMHSHKVMRCPECKSALWSYHPHLGEGIVFVGVGTLDHGERLEPEAHYFTRSKHPWVTLPAALPAFETLGDPGKASARTRIEAVLARQGGLGPSAHEK